jgi:hypothetical protein
MFCISSFPPIQPNGLHWVPARLASPRGLSFGSHLGHHEQHRWEANGAAEVHDRRIGSGVAFDRGLDRRHDQMPGTELLKQPADRARSERTHPLDVALEALIHLAGVFYDRPSRWTRSTSSEVIR